MNDSIIQDLDLETLRAAIQEEYETVALSPQQGFHFHTGRPLTRILGYRDTWLDGIPETSIESFAGTGNPFSIDEIHAGEQVVDVGCGAGIDSLIAAKMVGPSGKGHRRRHDSCDVGEGPQQCSGSTGWSGRVYRRHAESLPIPDGWADVVISNGVLNLMPDKAAALNEMARVLKLNGRLQIGDILVQKAVPESAKRKIDLWTG
jgi:SAM-dependent methyltransferase